jgi:hypothetical protein
MLTRDSTIYKEWVWVNFFGVFGLGVMEMEAGGMGFGLIEMDWWLEGSWVWGLDWELIGLVLLIWVLLVVVGTWRQV